MSTFAAVPEPQARLARITLRGETLTRLSPILAADRAQVVADLQAENRFAPSPAITQEAGPYALYLSIQEGRLVFDIRRLDDSTLHVLLVALGPFRRLIKDYHMLVESHLKAIEEGRDARIQAIDMGRRGLHDEGAQLMRQRLADKIDIDFATARRLFTLVCTLHQRISEP